MAISEKTRTILFWGISGIALIVGILHASSVLFVTDDAFISYRYAKNLVNGLGLVYNEGERVEGFTNFLWTVFIALGVKLNFDPIHFSTHAGIVFYALNILLFSFLSWRFRNNGKPAFIVLPLTSFALCLHHEFNIYATGGLETSMYAFFVSLGFALLLLGDSEKLLFSSGMAFVLAMMTRPDGVIFLVAACIYLLLTKKTFLKTGIAFLIPSLLVFLPYWLWRYNYYGYFFPNAFYAKSADLPYYSQGFEYAWMYFKTYYVFILIAIFGIVYFVQRKGNVFSTVHPRKIWDRLHSEEGSFHHVLLAALFIAAYTFFIVRVGGDFMFGRFFIPITPILFFLLETLVNQSLAKGVRLVVVGMILAATLYHNDQFKESAVVGYIADEARYYSEEHLLLNQKDGAVLNSFFKDKPVRVAFWASQLRLMYYADPYYALEASAGLTDPTISHQVLTERGRPGHEKRATPEHLLQKRIHFFFGPMEAPPPGSFVINAIFFDYIGGRIITYDNTIMEALKKHSNVRFVDLPRYLDEYLANIETYPFERVQYDYSFFKSFYFDHNADGKRQEAFEKYFHDKLQ